ncbi:extracellular solute-binding protein [Acidianus manzaensis]|uniref:ABC transporter substrate-binding protein n=1 Tax=Acidianus manzaensis TaxID=282676 RepID=A0A1W6JWP4_9CREN|nr:extracellular solute-binding protein [Acidianus manzaensis]ARM74683.1 ABC transporter substrate-binding protein [Acidianus manzaensis]
MTELAGITWDDPRGYNSIVEVSKDFYELTKIKIIWDKNSLYDFTVYSQEKLAEKYDLVIMDYPAVGDIAKSGKYLSLDEILSKNDIELIQKISVGKTFESYIYDGHIWAIPVDAASQVSAYRPDLFKKLKIKIPKKWKEVLKIKEKCKIGMPFSPIHAHSSFLTLSVNLGINPFYTTISKKIMENVSLILDILKTISDSCGEMCVKSDPIKLLNYVSKEDDICYVPLTYGYYNYSRDGYRKNVIAFANIPSFSKLPYGSVLGGAGLAISKRNKYIEETLNFVKWFYNFDIQKKYFSYLGQPADYRIWLDKETNAKCKDCYVNTINTILLAYVRPNFPGFVKLHVETGTVINKFLKGEITKEDTIEKIRLLNLKEYHNLQGNVLLK